jgi:hypothetical protein
MTKKLRKKRLMESNLDYDNTEIMARKLSLETKDKREAVL